MRAFLDFDLMRFEKFNQIRLMLFWKIFLSSKAKRFLVIFTEWVNTDKT